MNKIKYIVLLILLISFTGCGVTKETVVATEQSTGTDTEESIETRIESVGVLSAEKNPDSIWDIEWPYYYHQGGEIVQFPDSISMSDEDIIDALLDKACSIPSTAGDLSPRWNKQRTLAKDILNGVFTDAEGWVRTGQPAEYDL